MAKKYSVNVENDRVVSVEVDGVRYQSPDQIPDAGDRAQVEEMLAFGPFEAEEGLPDLESKPFPFTQILFGVFAGVAVLMFAIALVAAAGTVRRLDREVDAEGQVVDLVVRRDENGNEFHYPVVEFRTGNDGVEQVQLTEGSWPPAYAINEGVTIAYDPAQPGSARIRTGSSTANLWIVPIITGVLGLSFAGATLMVRRLFWPHPTRGQGG